MSTPDPFGAALAAQAQSTPDNPDPFGAALAAHASSAGPPPPKTVTPFLTQIGHSAEDVGGMVAHSAGNLVDIATGTNPGPGSYADKFSGPFKHDPDYTGEPYDIKEQVRQGLPKVDPYKILPNGPFQDEVRTRVPEFMEGAAAVSGAGGVVGGMAERSAASDAAAALEQGHPLTSAAEAETADMQTHANAAEAAGVKLPPREVSPAQAYVNNAARRDLNLPQNAPVTDGLLDAANKQNVSPAYEAAKDTPEFQLGPKYQKAISGIDLSKIDPEWQPPTDGTMDGSRAVELSGQLRSVARGMYEDASNPNLTYAQRTEARQGAQAHYQAAKAVEGGFREAATTNDAAQSAATGTPTTAATDVADAWDKARVYKAKVEAWRGALDGAGNVSGPKIKKLLADEPVSGPMKEVGSVVAQYPELFRGTRLQTPPEGMLKKGARAIAPIAGAAIGEALVPGTLGAMGGSALGEYAAQRFLGPGGR
jgi:hypothetical protein